MKLLVPGERVVVNNRQGEVVEFNPFRSVNESVLVKFDDTNVAVWVCHRDVKDEIKPKQTETKRKFTVTITDNETGEIETNNCDMLIMNAANRHSTEDKLYSTRLFIAGKYPDLARLSLGLAAKIHATVFSEKLVKK